MSKLTDEEMAVLIEKDPIKALCILVEEAGGKMTLYGVPVTESELRAHAEELADERIKRAICRGLEKQCTPLSPQTNPPASADGCRQSPSKKGRQR